DLGEGAPRTIVSGVAQAYRPEELVGRTVAVVANLPKKALRGVDSHGMVLFATGGPRGLTVVEVGEGVAPGSKVKGWASSPGARRTRLPGRSRRPPARRRSKSWQGPSTRRTGRRGWTPRARSSTAGGPETCRPPRRS